MGFSWGLWYYIAYMTINPVPSDPDGIPKHQGLHASSDTSNRMNDLKAFQQLELTIENQLLSNQPTNGSTTALMNLLNQTNYADIRSRIFSLISNTSLLNLSVINNVIDIFIQQPAMIDGVDIQALTQLITASNQTLQTSGNSHNMQRFQTALSALKNDSHTPATITQLIQSLQATLNHQQTLQQHASTIEQKQAKPIIQTPVTEQSNPSIPIVIPGITDVQVTKTNQSYQAISNELTIKFGSDDSFVDVIAKILITNGFALAFGTLDNEDISKHNPLIAAILQISNNPPVFLIPEIIAQLMLEMDAIVDENNKFKVAIVTDNVTTLSDIDPKNYIRKVSVSKSSHLNPYLTTYKTLYEEGYHYIISLHLNKNLRKRAYEMATKAKQSLASIQALTIDIYNTNANGVGQGLMVYELDRAIRHNYSPNELHRLVKQMIRRYKHWICPFESNFIKHHPWIRSFMSEQERLKLRLFNFIPIVELDQTLSICNIAYTKESAINELLAILDQEIKRNQSPITRLCIEYRTVYREAIHVRNRIKVKYPNLKISLQSVGSLTTKMFGDHLIGVCII